MYTLEDQKLLIATYEASGLSLNRFCTQHDVSQPTMSKWLKAKYGPPGVNGANNSKEGNAIGTVGNDSSDDDEDDEDEDSDDDEGTHGSANLLLQKNISPPKRKAAIEEDGGSVKKMPRRKESKEASSEIEAAYFAADVRYCFIIVG